MNREQRKYFTDRIDSELNKALTELQARTEKKIKQLPNKCEALANLMTKPQVRKAVCDAMQSFLMDQRPDTVIGDVSVYFKNRYSGSRSCTLDLSAKSRRSRPCSTIMTAALIVLWTSGAPSRRSSTKPSSP